MSELLKIAIQEIGVKEIPGPEHSDAVLKYAREAGFTWINDDETPWCSIFMSWCCQRAKLSHSKNAAARSWLRIGSSTSDPSPGDVVIFWRESRESWKGHVGIFMGYTASRNHVFCLGGNQRNSVSIEKYSSDKIIGFRQLETLEDLRPAKPELARGARGTEVARLQRLLNFLRYNCGDVDGIFGPKTEHALLTLQADYQLERDGKYKNPDHDQMESLLQS